jgi:hypothetical protein
LGICEIVLADTSNKAQILMVNFANTLISSCGLLTINLIKMEIQDVMKALAKKGISTSMHYNGEKDQCYVDLETRAKSELHLYEDGILRGRYQYENQIDLTQDIEELVTKLCHEFNNALHGRSYCHEAWVELCRSKGLVLKMYEM